jgi:threonine/homoserine/homoserine lactone efflux protein
VDALLLGLSIGLAAGISPGPLLVLVITSTLRSGWRAGTLAACAPLVSDLLVVTLTLLVLDHLPHQALGVLGVVGGVLVGLTGVRTILESRSATLTPDQASGPSSSIRALRQAAIVNIVSPHPWIAWATALGPLVISTWRDGAAGGVALVAGFYLMLVGTKVAVAFLVAGGRRRLTDGGYRKALAAAGSLLVLVGVALIVEFAPTL